MMKRLLAVLAHPDDESAIAGTLAHYAGEGFKVGLVCATKGEAGEISDPDLATPDTLAKVRERELRCSCDVIGVETLHLLGYCDSGMQGTAENEKPTAFIRASDEDVQRKLVRIYRQFKPHVVITFEPFGWYGHPDHIAAGNHATVAYHLTGSPQAFPEVAPPWQPDRLYHAVIPRSDFKRMFEVAQELDIDLGGFEDFPVDERDPLEEQITHGMDVGDHLALKDHVMDCHRTQFGEENLFRRLPREVMHEIWRFEHFIQVSPVVQGVNSPVGDLFAGL
jgi:LmbE family N-acetylglucosaminyl deacetylase